MLSKGPATVRSVTDARVARIRRDISRLAADHHEFAAIPRPVPVEVLEPGFPGMIHLILGQQVSIEAADAMYRRLVETLGAITPDAVLRLDDATMRACGFTRMKADYARGLADAVLGGLDLGQLAGEPLGDAVHALVSLRGIGRWTAECYLLFCEGRRDVFPAGDLALRRGWQEVTRAGATPSEGELREIAARWAPRRSAAAHLIWHAYLTRRGRR